MYGTKGIILDLVLNQEGGTSNELNFWLRLHDYLLRVQWPVCGVSQYVFAAGVCL
jgi:hypothetical protein